MPSEPSKNLETFPNPGERGGYLVRIECPEFTCLCPKTGQPDFADVTLEYVPGSKCVELKSLKLYYWSFREEGHFHENVTNRIASDINEAVDAVFLRVTAYFNVRGGITTTVFAEHGQRPDWVPRIG